ncbi:MAG: zinc ribbon domain-containing protein [Spirochaetaceae bacterium]|nr:zinc ribbon domain-containing protein [Spirochaetaceae bacterium]
MTEQKFCQSCGMPLETVGVIGTNADQSKNEDYCFYCFKDGAFTQDVTMESIIRNSSRE